MDQANGSRFKLVYSHWYYRDTRAVPIPNGLLPVTVDYIKSLEDANLIKTHLRIPSLDCKFQTSEIGYFFRHSNFIWHFCRIHSENNLITEDQVIDDGSIYYFPIEVEWAGVHILSNPKNFTLDGIVYEYKFGDSLTGKMLELLKSGKVTLLITNLVDAAVTKGKIQDFERVVNNLGIDSKYVMFSQGNKLNFAYEKDPSCKIKLSSGMLSLYQAFEQLRRYPFFSEELNYINDIMRPSDLNDNKVRSKKLLCFNRSMNRPHRLLTAHVALKYNLLNENIFSFVTNLHTDRQQIIRHLRELRPGEDFQTIADQIINLVPYELDTQHLTNDQKQGFQTIGINKKEWYENTYVHIVSESQFDDELDPFFSEKTWRPIMNLQPFLFIGNCNSLARLQELGFKTFHPYIDESYDSEQNPQKRFRMIEEEIKKLSSKSLQELHDWYYSITETLIYNQDHLVVFSNYDPYKELYK
jgi:hypothetical protein